MDRLRVLAGILIALSLAVPVAARATEMVVIIETAIRDVPLAAQVGMKSRQTITINLEARRISTSFETGVTSLPGVTLRSVRDKFTVENASFTDDGVSFRARGQTASGVMLLPDIDYDFKITINRRTNIIVVGGCHNEYPSYSIALGRKIVYDRLQTGVALWGLAGDCDIQVNVRDRL